MCYHSSHPNEKQIRKQYKSLAVEYSQDEIFHISGFTRPYLPVLLNDQTNTVREARWKLIPYWVKDEEGAAKYANTLNAEGESIFTKASYKPYIGKNRGLLFVTGFYEPHKITGVKDTQNYFLYMPEKRIFTLGVVWSEFNGYPTFSVITTAANDQLAEIHNEKKRMPLILHEADHEQWLYENDPSAIKQLIKPFDQELQAHQVVRVTAARGVDTNIASVQEPIAGSK